MDAANGANMTPTPLQFCVYNKDDMDMFRNKILPAEHIPEKGLLFKWGRIKNVRTQKQQNAIEVYCRNLAEKLNDAGMLIREEFLGKEMEIDWTQELAKDRLWRGTQKKLFDKESTTELETTEVNEVYETLNRFFSEVGIHVPFPSRGDQWQA